MKFPSPKKPRPSIKRDPIHPRDFLYYQHMISCEDCSHFDFQYRSCTIGYVSEYHQKDFQMAEYERTGKMALCRFLEID